MYENQYSKIVDALVSDGYIVLDNLFTKELLDGLLAKAEEEYSYKQAGISSSATKQLDSSRRRDKIRWLDEDNGYESLYLQFARSFQEYMNQTLYLGLRYYEAHFALYEEGDFYEKHLDAFQHSKNRLVTTVLYLNEDWKSADGGTLVLYDEAGEKLEELLPTMGKMVIFMSEKFPHEVLPSHKKRHSIAGWFRIDR